jgi:hypothetical protein
MILFQILILNLKNNPSGDSKETAVAIARDVNIFDRYYKRAHGICVSILTSNNL